jgi:hypothetical protein
MSRTIGTTLQIWGSRLPQLDSYGFGDFAVEIHGDGLCAHRVVRTMEQGRHSIRSFFGELAEDWQGARGGQTSDAVEHGMSIEVRRDSFGRVLATFCERATCSTHGQSGQPLKLSPAKR